MTDFQFNGYDIVARARDQKVIYYQSFGGYQGEWLLASKDDKNYFIYKGSYGSCSGCDSLEAEDPKTKEDAIKFSEDYKPFLITRIETMREAVKSTEFETVLPNNIRDDYSDINLDEARMNIRLLIKSQEGLITAKEILEIKNLEYRREAIEQYGEEKFMEDLGGDQIDSDGKNTLLKVKHVPEDFVYVKVKDASTPRRYLLRVPPDTKTVKEGIAWTFNMKPEEYKLEQES